eukprot:Hpha_TRINITY_DN26192_c0_g1::TRINITY_DN26192_c0_g1_i1::g.155489::m.155489
MPLPFLGASLLGASAGAAGGVLGTAIGNFVNRATYWVKAQRSDEPRANPKARLYCRYKKEQCGKELALGCIGGALCGAATHWCIAAGCDNPTHHLGARAATQGCLCGCCGVCLMTPNDHDNFEEWQRLNEQEMKEVGVPPPGGFTCGGPDSS